MPFLYIELGESSQKKLTSLEPLWLSTEQRVNTIPHGQLMLSVQGKSLNIGQYNNDVELCKPGEKINIYVRKESSKELIFSGLIVAQDLKLDRSRAELLLTLKHPLASLESTCRSQVFSNQSAEQIVEQLLSAQGIRSSNSAKMSAKQEQLVQYSCSDWNYIRRLLDENGAWLIADFSRVSIIQPSVANQAKHTLSSNDVNSNAKESVFEASWQFSDQYQPKNLRLTGWDITQQKIISANASPENLGQQALSPAEQKPLNESTWVVGSSVSLRQQELDNLAQSTLQRLQESNVQGQFKVEGSADYQVGETLALSGFGKGFDGKGIIAAIAHNVDSNIWTTVISLGTRCASSSLVDLPPLEGLHVGVVTDFKEDPGNLYRVQVRLPALADSKESNNNVLWARLAMPYASKESGFYFYPDIGDEVIVSFVEQNPCFPIIVGAMYNPKNKAPVPMSKDNSIKGIALNRENQSLSFEFNSQSNSIVVAVVDKAKGKGTLKVESSSGSSAVDISAKKIDLKN